MKDNNRIYDKCSELNHLRIDAFRILTKIYAVRGLKHHLRCLLVCLLRVLHNRWQNSLLFRLMSMYRVAKMKYPASGTLENQAFNRD